MSSLSSHLGPCPHTGRRAGGAAGWGLRADAAHGRCYSLEVQTGKASSWGPEELVLWEEVTQRLSWVPCPSPVSQGTVFLPPLQHCSAPWRGSSRWGGGELWATFPLFHGGFPCWTSSSLHVHWELGADLEQLSWSLLEPCSCRAAWSLTPDTASDAFTPSFSASSSSFGVL